MERKLKITVGADWKAGFGEAMGAAFHSNEYQGEELRFESPGLFFSRLSEKRWALVEVLLGAGEVGVRELAKRLGRDVKRVHEDTAALVDMGLIEKTSGGEVLCPFSDIHVDLHLRHAV